MALSRAQGSSMRTVNFASLLLLAFFMASAHGVSHSPPPPPKDMVAFYAYECPTARGIVESIVKSAINKNIDSAAALLNLHFHDCFVRGCDGSILLDSTYYSIAEKESGIPDSPKAIAYEIIDEIKAAVEKVCPNTVSCADIVALAARDAIVELGGPGWTICSGRRDGFVSYANETQRNMPKPTSDYFTLVRMFAAKGLTEKDMVVLSGAHTIGKVKCSVIETSLYNSTGPCGVDPTLEEKYAMELKSECPVGSSNLVYLDPSGSTTHANGSVTIHARNLASSSGGSSVDSNYYKRVVGRTNTGSEAYEHKPKRLLVRGSLGTLKTDRVLVSTTSGKALVEHEASGPNNEPFFQDFVASMEKLSNLGVLSAPAGEVRCNCRQRNMPTAPPPVHY